MNLILLHILMVVFFATLIRSAFGFGEALFAVPLLALRIPIPVAAPLAVLISITIAAMVVAQDHDKIHFRSASGLVFATIFGIPVGLLLLTAVNQQIVKLILAGIILAFAFYSLFGGAVPELRGDHRGWLLSCGFAAGVLGGAYGMNGPPLVVYGALRRWSSQEFRATLQGYFLPASILGMGGYWAVGLWTAAVTHYYLLSLPVLVPAVVLGRILNRRLHGDAFLKYVYAGLAGTGIVLLIQALR
ncbi:MAG: sulfite exporter TauE/SafE family protein [Acidobacteriaceae bacterium]